MEGERVSRRRACGRPFCSGELRDGMAGGAGGGEALTQRHCRSDLSSKVPALLSWPAGSATT